MRYFPLFKKSGLSRELLLGIAISAFVFVCALAWGGPFLSNAPFGAATRAQQSQTRSGVFSGIVVRTGEHFGLRETSGQIYRLDDPRHAQGFEGKTVTVTGTLDSEADLIHVEQIESPAA